MLASADAPLLQAASRSRRRRRSSGSVDDSSKQVEISHIMRLAISCGVLRGANFREASQNDAKMATPETFSETGSETMYEKARTSVLLPKRNV